MFVDQTFSVHLLGAAKSVRDRQIMTEGVVSEQKQIIDYPADFSEQFLGGCSQDALKQPNATWVIECNPHTVHTLHSAAKHVPEKIRSSRTWSDYDRGRYCAVGSRCWRFAHSGHNWQAPQERSNRSSGYLTFVESQCAQD